MKNSGEFLNIFGNLGIDSTFENDNILKKALKIELIEYLNNNFNEETYSRGRDNISEKSNFPQFSLVRKKTNPKIKNVDNLNTKLKNLPLEELFEIYSTYLQRESPPLQKKVGLYKPLSKFFIALIGSLYRILSGLSPKKKKMGRSDL